MNNNGRTAILVVSFGTTHPDTLARCIEKTEQAIAAEFPEYPIYRAFTSGMVIRRLKEKQDVHVDTVAEALERIAADGYSAVAVQPTLLLSGIEYELLLEMVKAHTGLHVAVGKPLIPSAQDCEAVASIIMKENPLAEDEALLLMGHGTEHAANAVYQAMEATFAEHGYRAFLGTVEGKPSFEDTVERLAACGAARAKLLPLLFVAGDHAKNDMAGEKEGSLINLVRQANIAAEPIIRGLGESEAVRALYINRVRETLERLGE